MKYRLLGSGNYGEVHIVNYKYKQCAGKVLHYKLLPGYPNVSKSDMNRIIEQFKLKFVLSSEFFHPNIEQFVEITCLTDSGEPVIITELLTESLTAYISRSGENLSFILQLSLCKDMAQGLEYLHSQQLIHGNLHGNNVLITKDHHAKVADYLCPLLFSDVATDNSLGYLPPETIQNSHIITVKSNVFTLAVLFLQAIIKHPPQPSKDTSLVELERHCNDLSSIPKSHPLLSLIQSCLSNHEVARPLMTEVCDHLTSLMINAQTMIFKLIHTIEHVSIEKFQSLYTVKAGKLTT